MEQPPQYLTSAVLLLVGVVFVLNQLAGLASKVRELMGKGTMEADQPATRREHDALRKRVERVEVRSLLTKRDLRDSMKSVAKLEVQMEQALQLLNRLQVLVEVEKPAMPAEKC